MMDLSKLDIFYTVANEGSVNKAAKVLNITQSALSRSIMLFEHSLKMTLFERSSKGMRLTPQGERVYEFAKHIMQEAKSFEEAFYETHGEIEGELRVITTPFLGTEWFLPKVQKFLEDHPKIRLKLILRENRDVNVEEGDVALFHMIHNKPELMQRLIFSQRIRLFASAEYLEKHGTPRTPGDLDHHRLITYGGMGYNPYGRANWVLNLGKEPHEASRESYLEINSLYGLVRATLQGHGISEMPTLPGVVEIGMIEVSVGEEGPESDIHFIYHEKRKSSRKIQVLQKYLLP